MTSEEKRARYAALLHAVQTGIAWELQLDHPEADLNTDENLRAHKHLRTGIDGSKSDHGALAELLIERGVFTLEDYEDALLRGLEREKARYERVLSERVGAKITLA
jgi:hypothetical protein